MNSTQLKQFKERIDLYNKSPNICLNCNTEILHLTMAPLSQTKIKKFCDQKCAAVFNNKRQRNRLKKVEFKEYKCLKCGDVRLKQRGSLRQFPQKVSCLSCSKRSISVGTRTKEDIFSSRKNWQSARTGIRVHAERVMLAKKDLKVCKICGYSNHVEICHIKPVSDFGNEITIDEINDPKNLIYLCPNHHWEFDNGLLTL